MDLNLSRTEWYRRIKYIPRISQKAMDDAVDAGYRYVSYFAFPRCGKSFGAAKIVGLRLLQPDHHAWIVAPTYPLGSKEFGYVWNDLNEQGLLDWADPKNGGSKAFDSRGGNMYIKFPWGAFLEVKSADNPTSLRAEEPDTLLLAEASGLNPDIYHRHLYGRTEKRQGLVLVPTTPMGRNWVYDSFRVPSRKTDRGGAPNPLYDPHFWSCVVSADPDLVEPANWDLADIYEPGIHTLEAVADAKRRLPPPIFIEQFGGGFASYAGRVLPYDARIHRVRPFVIPDHWTHIVGWDHGSSPSQTAILIGSYAPDGTLYWWAELYTAGWTIRQYWEWVKRTLGPNKSVSLVAIDPSAKQVRIELANLGVSSNIPGDKQIEAGVIRLTQLLNLGQMKFFDLACPKWEGEAARMEWDEKNPKKILHDHLYHAISATRYATLITVTLPVDEEGPEITATLETNPREYWRQANRKRHSDRWKKWNERIKRDQDLERIDKQEEVFNYDPFDEAVVVEDFDVATYFDE